MEVGLYIRDYMDDPDRPMHLQVEEAAEVCRRAPDAAGSTLLTGILLLPGHNPVDITEQAVAMDHSCSEVGVPALASTRQGMDSGIAGRVVSQRRGC